MEISTPVCQESSFFESIVLGVYKIALNKEYPLYQKKIIDQTEKNYYKKSILPFLTILYDHRSRFKFEVIHITWAFVLLNTFSIMKNSIISTEATF